MSQLLTQQPTTTEQAWSSLQEIARDYVDGFLTMQEAIKLADMYSEQTNSTTFYREATR